MKFSELELIGFSDGQAKRIRRKCKPEDVVNLDLTEKIADITGYCVGLLMEPGEPPKIVRLYRRFNSMAYGYQRPDPVAAYRSWLGFHSKLIEETVKDGYTRDQAIEMLKIHYLDKISNNTGNI